jgi:hypothetical protein
MVWGFPLVLKGKSGQPLKPKPCNNTRADKLDSFMWRYSFEERLSHSGQAVRQVGDGPCIWFAQRVGAAASRRMTG